MRLGRWRAASNGLDPFQLLLPALKDGLIPPFLVFTGGMSSSWLRAPVHRPPPFLPHLPRGRNLHRTITSWRWEVSELLESAPSLTRRPLGQSPEGLPRPLCGGTAPFASAPIPLSDRAPCSDSLPCEGQRSQQPCLPGAAPWPSAALPSQDVRGVLHSLDPSGSAQGSASSSTDTREYLQTKAPRSLPSCPLRVGFERSLSVFKYGTRQSRATLVTQGGFGHGRISRCESAPRVAFRVR